MKLPIPSILSKKPQHEYYLALLLRDEKATAVILQEDVGKVRIIGTHEEYFATSIEDASLEILLETLDKAISRAEEALPPDVETQKTVFGVKDSWVEEKKIKKDYLGKLKKVSDALNLSPIGFLVISEAMAHLIQEEEGAPVSAIIAEIGKKTVTLSLFRAGRLIETHADLITDTIPKTVDTLLKHFEHADIFPSRIIIFNGDKHENIVQEFITHQWSKTLSFLHMPQIGILPAAFDAKAVVFGAALQMGFSVLGEEAVNDVQILPTHASKKEIEKAEEFTDTDSLEEKLEPISPREPKPLADAAEVPIEGDNFGFVADEDITKTPKHEPKEAVTNEQDTHEKQPESGPKINYTQGEKQDESFGFRDQDAMYAVTNPVVHEKHADEDTLGKEQLKHEQGGGSPLKALGSIGTLMLTPFKRMRSLPLGALVGGNKLMLFLPIVAIVLIGLFIAFLLKVQATATLVLNPQVAEQKESVTFSTSDPKDLANHIISAKEVTTTVDGSVTGDTTGKKDTGTKAKGSVTLYSRLTSSTSLASGTKLQGPNGLSFTLDKDVLIASNSGDASAAPTTTSVSVTASDIGKEANMPSGTKFTIASYSTDQLVAKNDSAFSGGTKTTVTAVSKDDQIKLAQNLQKNLEDKAKTALAQKLDGSEQLLPIFTDETLSDKSYSKNVGDEAKSLTLTAKVTYTALAYNQNDLKEFSQAILKEKQTQDQTFSDNSISNSISDAKQKNDTAVTASVNLKAGLLPKIDLEQTRKEITGKSVQDARDILTKLPQVSDVTFKFSPSLPFLTNRLPRLTNHVHLVLQTK